MFKRFLSEQLGKPSGLIGRHLLPIIWNWRNASLNDSTLARLAPRADDYILDVGFGGGYLIGKMLEQVGPFHVSGVDASEEIVDYCNKKFDRQTTEGRVALQCARVDRLPFPNEHFNKICSVNSLFYWSDLVSGIREIYRVLVGNGLIVLTYTFQEDLDKRGFSPRTVHSYDDGEVIGILQQEGFHDVQLEQETDKYRRYSIVTGRK